MTPKFIERLRERDASKNDKSKNAKFRVKEFVTFYGAIAGSLLSLYNFYENHKPKKHDMDIFIADFQVKEDKIQYGIAFYNNGDFTEVVANAKSILGQRIDGFDAPLSWEQNRCFEPVVVKPKETSYVTYLTEYKMNDQKYKISTRQRGEYQVLVDFDILSPEFGVVNERFLVGELRGSDFKFAEVRNEANYEFVTTKKKVDFGMARPRVIIGTYPVDEEFVVMNLCGNQQKNNK